LADGARALEKGLALRGVGRVKWFAYKQTAIDVLQLRETRRRALSWISFSSRRGQGDEMKRSVLRAGLVLASLVAGSASALALDVEGIWMREDGASRIQFSPCGPALCGVVVWLKNPASKAHVGERVFYDMARAGPNSWTGKAFNPEDGKTYSGKMVLEDKKLRTSGCVLGGLICKNVVWLRAN
jgi:uncharacterized protein (DUF2147 family)